MQPVVKTKIYYLIHRKTYIKAESIVATTLVIPKNAKESYSGK